MSHYPKIPVLVYHKIAEPSDYDVNPNTCVTPSNFESQMRLMARLGYLTADPAENETGRGYSKR